MDAAPLPDPPSRLREKLVIVINGKGGSGKDTVCAAAARSFRVRTVSAITPIKEIAARCGWDGGKDNRSRKFLSDLKRVFTEYNGLPNRYLDEQYRAFEAGGDDILFVHIREGDQIDDFRRRVRARCVTLLVRSPRTGSEDYGNDSDDNAEDYPYDYCYCNDRPLEELEADFTAFLCRLLLAEGVAGEDALRNLPR